MDLGRRIGARLASRQVVALDGTLGAGKTTLVKGIAEALGVEEPITSPTFTILSEYSGSLPLHHADLYRIGSSEELELLGFDELLDRDGVTVVEWSAKARTLPRGTIHISISIDGEGRRLIEVDGLDV